MAGPTRNELVMEIGKLLSIWSKLKANDKQNCKQLIDTKIRTLRDCKRPQFEGPYAFMDIVVALESKLVAAKFDLGSITVVISKEMEDLMNKIGLQYSRGEGRLPDAPQFEINVLRSEYFTISSSPGVTYSFRFEKDYHGTGTYRYILFQIQGNVKMETGMAINDDSLNKPDYHYEQNNNKVVFMDDEESVSLYL